MLDAEDSNYSFFEKLLPDKKEWYTVKEAAAILEFEHAALIRDKIEKLKSTMK